MASKQTNFDGMPGGDEIRDLHTQLGIITVRFALIESTIASILATLIHPEDNLLAATLTEHFGLDKKLDMINRISLFRSSYETELRDLVKLIRPIQKVRNEFIHGIWHFYMADNGEARALCEVRRIKFSKHSRGRTWQHNTTKDYRSSTLQTLISELGAISLLSKNLLELLDEDDELRHL